MAKFKLKEGVVINPFGMNTEINNDNLTDSIAEYLLESGKATKDDFETGNFKDSKPKDVAVEPLVDANQLAHLEAELLHPENPILEEADKTSAEPEEVKEAKLAGVDNKQNKKH